MILIFPPVYDPTKPFLFYSVIEEVEFLL